MPWEPKAVWPAHFKAGTTQFKKADDESPAMIVFLVELDAPARFKGRLIEVRLTHEVFIAALVNDLVQAMREKGTYLPETMG